MDDIQNKLGLKLQQIGLSYQNNERLYYQAFAEPKSLYSSFKEIISNIEESQTDDESYLEILTELISDQNLSQFKGAEIFEAWIIYQIKVTFGFAVSIDAMLQIIRNHYIKGKFDVELCLQKIANKNYPKIKDRLKWKNQQKELIQIFVQKRQTQIEYFRLNRLFKNKNKKQQSNILDQSFTVQSISGIVQINQSSFQQSQILKYCFPEPQISNIARHSLALKNIKVIEKQLRKAFQGMIVNYQHFDKFIVEYHRSPRILKYAIDRLKFIDNRFLKKINDYKDVTISINNQLAYQYLQSIINAQMFYNHISTFIAQLKQEYNFRINIQFLKGVVEKFLIHFESCYWSVIKSTYQQQLNSIQQKFSYFFLELEKMFSRFFSQQYEKLKANMFNRDQNGGLNINWPSLKGKKINDCICIIVKAIRNKLSYIFTEFGNDYKQIRQALLINRKSPEIVQLILFEIKKCDQHYWKQINGMKKYFEDLTFEDQNLSYIKKIKKAYIFASEIASILKDIGEQIDLKLSIQYLQSSLKPFVQHYQNFYIKILERIYKLKYKLIPQNIQLFLSNLEQLTSKLLPKDYQIIKCKILKIPLNQDLNIQFDITQDKSIVYRLCKINQILREAIEVDCTKVINVLKEQSTQYFDYLEQQQKKAYLKRLREQFRRKAEKYIQQINEEQVDDQKSLKDIFRRTPIPQSQTLIKQQLSNCFREIKQRFIYNKRHMLKKILEEQKNNNITEMFEIYCKMSKNQKINNKSRLIKAINNDFQSISKCDKRQMTLKYYELCNKYEEQLQVTKEFSEEYQNVKLQALDNILKEITNLVACSQKYLEGLTLQHMHKIIFNNQIILRAYLQFGQRDSIHVIVSLTQNIQKYFGSIFGHSCEIQNSNDFSLANWQYQDFQKYIRQQFCIKEITEQLIKQKDQIIVIKKNNVFNGKQYDKKSLQKIAKQILLMRKQICNLSFSEFIQTIKSSTRIQQQSKNYLQQLKSKIFLLKKLHPIYNQYGLDKLDLQGNTNNLGDYQPFEKRIENQLKIAFQQIKNLQKYPQQQLTNRLNLIFYLCSALSYQKDQVLSKFMLKINQNLELGLHQVINGIQRQIQSFQNDPFKKGIIPSNKSTNSRLSTFELEFYQNPDNIDKATKIAKGLIVMEKLQSQIQFAQLLMRNRILKIVQLIKDHKCALILVIKGLQDRLDIISQVRTIANKYQPFRSVLKTKDITQFVQQLKDKNTNLNLKYGQLISDYQNFKKIYQRTIKRYFLNPSQETIKAISNDVQSLIEKSPQFQTLGMIFGLYGILKRNQQNEVTFKPYPSQFVALSLILFFRPPQTNLNKKILQMLPGEGKSVVLGFSACYLALKQYNIYQVCYSQYLLNKDQQEFKQLFGALGVKQRIKYRLLDQLCKQIINPGSVMLKIKNLLLNQNAQNNNGWFGAIAIAFQSLGQYLFEQSKDVILVDGIDILFSDKFEGKIIQQNLQIYDEGNDNIIQNIFEYIYQKSKTSYLKLSSLKGTDLYKFLLQKYPRVSEILELQVLAMLNDVVERQKINYFYQMLKHNPEGNLNQQQNDFNGYHQSYAYLKLKQQGLVSQKTVKTKLKICIKIGKYSYCDLAINFHKIIGVSGTFDYFSKKDKLIPAKEYGIQNFYHLPLLFAQGHLFEEKYVIASSKLDLYHKILDQIAKNFTNEKGRNALIIFFKDQQTLGNCKQLIAKSDVLRQQLTKIKLNYILDQQSNKSSIELATLNNCVTLATHHQARGIYFQNWNITEGLYVIMAEVPNNIQELFQVKKRTARAGKPGKFKLIILDEELTHQRQSFCQIEEQIWSNKYEQSDRSRERTRISARKQHQDTIQRITGNKILQYLKRINFVQSKKVDRSVLLIFGFQANLFRIQQYTQCLDILLTQYQKLIKEHFFDIKMQYQACFFGSYATYNPSSIVQNMKPIQKIFKTTNICSLSEFKQELKRMKMFCQQKSLHQGMNGVSIQLFLKHVHDESYHQKIVQCFIWSHSRQYSWQYYKKSMQFKRHQISIKKQLNIETDMKTSLQYLKIIKSKGILVNFIWLNTQVDFIAQMLEISRFSGKQSFIYIPNANFQDKFKRFFISRIQQAITFLKQIKMQ